MKASILAVAICSACGPDLTIEPGDSGNLTGVWTGEVSYGGDVQSFTLWIEQDGSQVVGVGEISFDQYQRVSVDGEMPCNIDGISDGDLLKLTVPTWDGPDVLLHLALDVRKEKLAGRWGADVAIDVSGPIEMQRRAWLPTRIQRRLEAASCG